MKQYHTIVVLPKNHSLQKTKKMKFIAVALAFIGVAAGYAIDNLGSKPLAVAQPALIVPNQQLLSVSSLSQGGSHGISLPYQPSRPLQPAGIITSNSALDNQAVNAAYNAGYHQAVANNQGAQLAAWAQQQQQQQQQLINAGLPSILGRPTVVGSLHGKY